MRGKLEMESQCYFDALPNVLFWKGGERELEGGGGLKKEEKKRFYALDRWIHGLAARLCVVRFVIGPWLYWACLQQFRV